MITSLQFRAVQVGWGPPWPNLKSGAHRARFAPHGAAPLLTSDARFATMDLQTEYDENLAQYGALRTTSTPTRPQPNPAPSTKKPFLESERTRERGGSHARGEGVPGRHARFYWVTPKWAGVIRYHSLPGCLSTAKPTIPRGPRERDCLK